MLLSEVRAKRRAGDKVGYLWGTETPWKYTTEMNRNGNQKEGEDKGEESDRVGNETPFHTLFCILNLEQCNFIIC